MGISYFDVYDEDGVTGHNIPNQFYRNKDVRKFKVEALSEIIKEFSDSIVKPNLCFFKKQKLQELVIVSTDSMASRKMVWEQFKKQLQCKYYIEVRMGAELGRCYFIFKKSESNYKKYEKTLYSDKQAVQLPCTERSIIYNVLMISSLVGRGVKALVNNENFPFELIFDMKNLYKYSFMIGE